MNIKKHIGKKVVGIGLVAGLVLGAGGAAFAYFDGGGTGTGTAVTGTANGVTITGTVDTPPLYPDNTGHTVTFAVDNPNSGNAYIGAITLTGVTSNDTGCNTFLADYGTGQFTMGAVTVDGEVGPGTTDLGQTGTLTWTDEAYNQAACADVTMTFTFTSS